MFLTVNKRNMYNLDKIKSMYYEKISNYCYHISLDFDNTFTIIASYKTYSDMKTNYNRIIEAISNGKSIININDDSNYNNECEE